MLLAELLGGNEINGFENGTVIVDGEELEMNYYELIQICGNVPLGEVNEDWLYNKRVSHYHDACMEYLGHSDVTIDDIRNNKLMVCVAYSEYEIDWENKTLILNVQAYDYN